MKNLEYRKIAQSVNLGEILISSDVKLSDNFNDGFIFSSKAKEIGISISKDDGEKCPRCWKQVRSFNKSDDLCDRCFLVINENN